MSTLKLEDLDSYIQLQKELNENNNLIFHYEERNKVILRNINTLKRDFYEYEMSQKGKYDEI